MSDDSNYAGMDRYGKSLNYHGFTVYGYAPTLQQVRATQPRSQPQSQPRSEAIKKATVVSGQVGRLSEHSMREMSLADTAMRQAEDRYRKVLHKVYAAIEYELFALLLAGYRVEECTVVHGFKGGFESTWVAKANDLERPLGGVYRTSCLVPGFWRGE